MDDESKRLWLAFVRAEHEYRLALGNLRHANLEQTLREGLDHLPWRRQALIVLQASNVEFTVHLLPQLFSLAAVSHSLLGEVRNCILRISREALERELSPLVDALVVDQNSDYEAYRRIAELLRLIDARELLAVLVAGAERSQDTDIREVAEDFRNT